MGEGAVPGAEVVDGNLDPDLLEPAGVGRGLSVVAAAACFNLICHHPADPGSVVGWVGCLESSRALPKGFLSNALVNLTNQKLSNVAITLRGIRGTLCYRRVLPG